MEFTALHRALGLSLATPLSDEMIDDLVTREIAEADDLDFKSVLPPTKNLNEHDFVKDVAAMANSGGGVIVFGLKEAQKAASARCDAGELTEKHERTLRSVAVTAVSPPVFNLGVYRLGQPDMRSVVIVVPASVDGPHLIYRGEYFGAPVRNDADTVWMKERQIEAMYRARFEERRHATEALKNLYDELKAGQDLTERAWLFAVARPRLPSSRPTRVTREEARELFIAGTAGWRDYAPSGFHPLQFVEGPDPRPGLRRWVARNTATNGWQAARASIHDDGSVCLGAAVGGELQRDGQKYWPGEYVQSSAVEVALVDLFALVRPVSEALGTSEYEIRVGIEWAGSNHLHILTIDNFGRPYEDATIPLAQYTPVTATIDASVDKERYLGQLRSLAEDCINQGGIMYLQTIKKPSSDSEAPAQGESTEI
ncbi:transcriptional regulator [Nocardia sp. MDA0666]|uniref:AlbA family DNA-binding domain-containing protein n=1 Tax=Nocardia sp. MDA0666 TaxID=2135448 RepID=UPI000D11C402|nr:ATP-binding protein [Nocardia sp. MDA0666]PSR62135.1 transcriptional regulator [Nocardia sp. MDA0666]